jgi:hypothetical protein
LTSVVIIFALRHALDSCRAENLNFKQNDDDEYYSINLPASPENVFLASKNCQEQYLLN